MDMELYHYGVGAEDDPPGRGSGRYPKGSGENPFQHMDRGSFVTTAKRLKKDGWSDKEIAEYFFGEGASPSEYHRRLANAKEDVKNSEREKIIAMYNSGMGYSEIGRELGKNESTIRSMLDPIKIERAQQTENIAKMLSNMVSDQNYIDLGPGSEVLLGVKRTKLQASVQRLVDSGEYEVRNVFVPNIGVDGKNTTVTVLVPAGTPTNDIYQHLDRVNPIFGYHSNDNGKTWYGIDAPANLDSSRLMVRYSEDRGNEKDGVIELRRGVEDLSLGGANYAQVRIAVDGTHYLKGMAVYSDDMPPGIDVIFNTNKHRGTPVMGEDKKHSVLKPMKDDPDNPFGSMLKTEDGVVVGQRRYLDKDGVEHLSPVNIVREAGDWDRWSKNLASQFLSKQAPSLAKKQLNEAARQKEDELAEIMALTNPEIKKELLHEFADSCDSAAVHLKAASLPRQSTKVILPLTSLKDNEVYAPSYHDGEEVILVRYPHAGIFEIPRLIVNNRNKQGQEILGNALDAIGINSHVANRLSGADFDGDTAIVIPTANQKLKAVNDVRSSKLLELKDFDPKEVYGDLPEGYPKVGEKRSKGGDGFNTQLEMGKISNLITDMQLRDANADELIRAVKHSMVVIDAEKHQLNWKQSEQDNNIAELKNRYQSKENGEKGGGASTLLSRAKSPELVPKRREITNTKEMTEEELKAWKAGYKVYRETGQTKRKEVKSPKNMTPEELKRFESGKRVFRDSDELKTFESTKMAETKDARKLSSGTVMEEIYADYANHMKSLALKARKEERSTKDSKYDPKAAEIYSEEVKSLNNKILVAERNKPYERKAQTLANTMLAAKKADNPDMDYDEVKKVKSQCLNQARATVGANKKSVWVEITDKEWEAIQAHAISSNKVKTILANTNKDAFKERATPHPTKTLSSANEQQIKRLYDSGKYTLSEIADRFGVSASTVQNVVG